MAPLVSNDLHCRDCRMFKFLCVSINRVRGHEILKLLSNKGHWFRWMENSHIQLDFHEQTFIFIYKIKIQSVLDRFKEWGYSITRDIIEGAYRYTINLKVKNQESNSLRLQAIMQIRDYELKAWGWKWTAPI